MKIKKEVIILMVFLFFSFISAETTLSPSEVSTIVDADAPIIEIISPQNTTYSELNSIFFNYTVFDASTSDVWYSLNAQGNISISGPFYLNLQQGNYHLVIYANDSFSRMNFSEVFFKVSDAALFCGDEICSSNENCSVCSEDCGNCQPPNRDPYDNQNAGENKNVAGEINFQIEPEEIFIEMHKKESRIFFILVKNTGKSEISIDAEITDSLQNFVNLKEKNFNLKANEEKSFEIEFTTSESDIEDLYTGELTFKSKEIEKKALIILELESSNSLFDVRVNIKNKVISLLEKIIGKIEIIDVGGVGLVEVIIKNIIKNSKGEVVAEKVYTKTLEGKLDYTEELQIPKGASYGKYVLYIVVYYDEKVAIANDTFEVREKTTNFYLIILFFVFICAFYILIKRIKKIKIMFKKITGKIKNNQQ